ncbi:MAG: ribonuclease PH [Myxococcales bacterium FL481]|nr:MAG: ribonuclease PH [Myxococcales bacterium FL481]
MRPDGRRPGEVRTIRITPDFVPSALSSVLIETGRTRVICTISREPKVPSWLVSGGWLTAEYAMLPGATTPRGRRDPGGRGREIQRLIGRSLRASLDLSRLVGPTGALALICDCDVIEADGGTRTAAITGASVALDLALARLRRQGELEHDPRRGSVAAVSVGLMAVQEPDDPRPVVDLCYAEDHCASVDLNVVMLRADANSSLVELQGAAERDTFTRHQLNAMLDLAEPAIDELLARQREAVAQGSTRD